MTESQPEDGSAAAQHGASLRRGTVREPAGPGDRPAAKPIFKLERKHPETLETFDTDLSLQARRYAQQDSGCCKTIVGWAIRLATGKRVYGPSSIVGFHVFSLCPACRDATSGVCPIVTVGEQAGTSGQQAIRADRLTIRIGGPQTTVALVNCQCTKDHAKADGKLGCGASWLVMVAYDLHNPDTKATFRPVPEQEASKYWAGAEALEQSVQGSQSTVRATAATWQASLTALIAIIAVTSLVGRDTFQKLDAEWRGLAVALTVIAIATNAIAIYRATLAAAGYPRMRSINTEVDLVNADLAPLEGARLSIDNLKTATRYAMATLFFAVGVGLIVWLVPDEGVNATRISVTTLNQNGKPSSACLTLPSNQPSANASPPGNIKVVPTASPSATVIPLKSIVAISPCR